MIIVLTILGVLTYLVMGYGAYKLLKKTLGDPSNTFFGMSAILLWPIFLLFVCFDEDIK